MKESSMIFNYIEMFDRSLFLKHFICLETQVTWWNLISLESFDALYQIKSNLTKPSMLHINIKQLH